MSPDVGSVLSGVRDPPVSNPSIGVELEQEKRPLHALSITQLHRMTPRLAVFHHSGFDLGRSNSRSVYGFQVSSAFHLDNCREKQG